MYRNDGYDEWVVTKEVWSRSKSQKEKIELTKVSCG